MRAKYTLLFFLFGIALGFVFPGYWTTIQAQNFYPIVKSEYYPNDLTAPDDAGAITQDKNGITYIGFTYGVFEFDGQNRRLIATHSPVRALQYDVSTNTIYVACENSFGKLSRKPDGQLQYIVLSNKVKPGESPAYESRVLGNRKPQIFSTQGRIIFYYPFFMYVLQNEQLTTLRIGGEQAPASGGFAIGEQIYIQATVPETGIFRLIGNKLVKIEGNVLIQSQTITFYSQYDKTRTLIGTDAGHIYLTDGQTYTPYAQDVTSKLGNLNDAPIQAYAYQDRVVIASRASGCLIANRTNGQLQNIINVTFGLPESKINAAYLDINGRLWLCHEEKFSWTYITTPVSLFTDGLSGNVNAVLRAGRLYVATDNGVYYFSDKTETVNIDGSVIMSILAQRKAPPRTTASSVPTASTDIKAPPPPAGGGSKSFFNFLSSKKKKKEKEDASDAIARAEAERQEEERRRQQEDAENQRRLMEEQEKQLKKLQQDIIAAQYAASAAAKQTDFMRVGNLPEERFTGLALSNGRIYASSLNGLYLIDDKVGRKVGEAPTGRLIASSKIPGCLFALPPDNNDIWGAFLCDGNGCNYQIVEATHPYNGTIAETADGTVWLGSENGAVAFYMGNRFQPAPVSKIFTPNPNAQDKNVRVFPSGKTVLAIQEEDVYRFEDNKFVKKDELKKHILTNKRVFTAKNANNTTSWLCSDRSMFVFDANGNLKDSIYTLNIFDRLGALYVDTNQTFWLGAGARLVRFDAQNRPTAIQNFNCLIRSVFVNNKPVEDLNSFLSLPYSASHEMRFEFTAPAYDGIRYQYKIHEYDNWTEVETGRINLFFSYGEYSFRVRAIDVFGNISQEAKFDFSVATPLWLRWYFWAGILLVGVGGTFGALRYRQKALEEDNRRLNHLVDERTAELRVEKEKSDKYLKIILPEIIAEELKARNKVEAVTHRHVCVLFTDFKGFTQISEKMTPQHLISELEDCFERFDGVITHYALEKIKTIGDAYMAAGGVPLEDPGNHIKIVLAALEMARITAHLHAQRKAQNQEYWEIRIGIHCGSVVAGLVGRQRFTYDIWGDTVNTASRMESSGVPGKVNISGNLYELVKDYYVCAFRGKIPAKNKGDIEMYLVEGIKPELSEQGKGEIPNATFWQKLRTEFPGTVLPADIPNNV